jgi:guanylate kinase
MTTKALIETVLNDASIINYMGGTLELLCGPSGVGKTSSIGKKTKAYTYTTRPPREKEVDGVHRRFVTQQRFAKLVKENKIIAPYDALGHSYGFAADLKDALGRGEYVSEQIVPYESIDAVVDAFKGYGRVTKKLFLAFPQEIERRMIVRSYGNPNEKRILGIRDSVRAGLRRFFQFDYVTFNCLFLEFYPQEFKFIDRFFSAMWRASLEQLVSEVPDAARISQPVIDHLVQKPQDFRYHKLGPYEPAFLASRGFRRFLDEAIATAKRERQFEQLLLVRKRAEDFAVFREDVDRQSLDLMTVLEPYNRYHSLQQMVNDSYALAEKKGIDAKKILPVTIRSFLKALCLELDLPTTLIRRIYYRLLCEESFYDDSMRVMREMLPKRACDKMISLSLVGTEKDLLQPENVMVSGLKRVPPHGNSVYVIRGVDRSAGEILAATRGR